MHTASTKVEAPLFYQDTSLPVLSMHHCPYSCISIHYTEHIQICIMTEFFEQQKLAAWPVGHPPLAVFPSQLVVLLVRAA